MRKILVKLSLQATVGMCAVLCLASIVLLIWSHWRFDDIGIAWERRCINLCSYQGKFYFQNATAESDLWKSNRSWYYGRAEAISYPASMGPFSFQFAGFRTSIRSDLSEGIHTSEHVIAIPYWALALLTGLPPGLAARGWMLRRKRARRAALGLCPECGYDMRASGDRCPECGTIAARPSIPVRADSGDVARIS